MEVVGAGKKEDRKAGVFASDRAVFVVVAAEGVSFLLEHPAAPQDEDLQNEFW